MVFFENINYWVAAEKLEGTAFVPNECPVYIKFISDPYLFPLEVISCMQ